MHTKYCALIEKDINYFITSVDFLANEEVAIKIQEKMPGQMLSFYRVNSPGSRKLVTDGKRKANTINFDKVKVDDTGLTSIN